MSTIKYTSVPTKTLAESITSASTSFKVNNITGWGGTALVAADYGSIAYGVFRNSTNTLLEIFEFDPTTIASASITINKRGLNFNGDLTTQVTANKLAWTKGDTRVDLGVDTPQLLQFLQTYVDAAIVAGGVPSTTAVLGLVKMSTAPASAPSPIAVGDNDTRLPQNAYKVDTGTANAYAIAPSPAITAYATGQMFTFKAVNANTTTSTLNVNGLGAKTIKTGDGADLVTGQLTANQIVTVVYDGTNFLMVSSPAAKVPTIQTFTASGTYTKPAGLKYAIVEIQAPGGGGNGGSSTNSQAKSAGGHGGGYARKIIAAASIGATETVTLGAVGTAGTYSSNAGTAGGTTSFGALLSATGGGASTGSPGNGTGGDINVPGRHGGSGVTNSDIGYGGGMSGGSFLGAGVLAPSTTNTTGNNGGNYGAGGTSGSGNSSGGTGGPAIIVVTEYYA